MGSVIDVCGFVFTPDEWDRLEDRDRRLFSRYLSEERRPSTAPPATPRLTRIVAGLRR